MAKRRTTTKDLALLHQLFVEKQLDLAPEFQRKSVWPRAAKSYLIDTILHDLPIPPLLFQRGVSAQQGGRPSYSVIDGQQRLRAVFSFLQDEFRLTEPASRDWRGKSFTELSGELQQRVLDYDFVVEELSGFSLEKIKDIFVRTNKYTVNLSGQELRHAREEGAFAEFAERLGEWSFWADNKVLTPTQISRMRNVELAAELSILLAEGPQDKKTSIDVWYAAYREGFPLKEDIEDRLRRYLDWILSALPDLKKRRYRRPVDLYGLVGAIDNVSLSGEVLEDLDSAKAGASLAAFEDQVRHVIDTMKDPTVIPDGTSRLAARYAVATSRQTDNVKPRQTRIAVIAELIS